MAASLSFIVGIIGNIISLLVFLSPITTFKRIVRKKATENFKGIPYICTLLSTSLWTYYGFLKPGGLLIVTVNGAGALLQLIYVTLYIIYAPKDSKVKHLRLAGILNIGFYGGVVAITMLATHGSVRVTIVGFLCAGLTLGMYGSPLAIMRSVIKTKSVEYMPFSLTFFLFLNGGVWSLYSVLVKDFFIGVPNAIGFVLGSAQLIIYIIYRKKGMAEKTIAKDVYEDEEEGSAHLVHGGTIELGTYDDPKKEKSLIKGWSLPKPSAVSRQLSFQKILKSHSMNVGVLPLEDDDVENHEQDTNKIDRHI